MHCDEVDQASLFDDVVLAREAAMMPICQCPAFVLDVSHVNGCVLVIIDVYALVSMKDTSEI
jgi:hypothetical protein